MDIVYAYPGCQYCVRHTPLDRQVRSGDSQVELHAGSTEDVGSFYTFFWTSHRELRETSDITVEDAGMHHANMVFDVVAELQKALQQEQT